MPTSRLKSDTSVVSWYIRCGRFVVMDPIQRNSVTSGSAGSGLPIATTAGQQSADSFRNAGPWNHLCREESDEAGVPREASSAELTSPGTWRHCVSTELSRILVMQCPTNALNRREVEWVHYSTIIEFVPDGTWLFDLVSCPILLVCFLLSFFVHH